MRDFFDAISSDTFSNELNGLSNTIRLTFGFKKSPWLRIMATDPMDLPHNTQFSYFWVSSKNAKIAVTSSCYLNPNDVIFPQLFPLPEKSNEQTSYGKCFKCFKIDRTSSLFEPNPWAQTIQVFEGPLLMVFLTSNVSRSY